MHLQFIHILFSLLHPFFVSMTEVKYIPTTKEMEVSVRIFTDDLENTLRKNHPGYKLDIVHPKDRALVDKWLDVYIKSRLQLKTSGKVNPLKYIGYEQENESIWVYFEVKNVAAFKQISVFNTLLYDYKKEQINMIRIENGAKDKSSKLQNPENTANFQF